MSFSCNSNERFRFSGRDKRSHQVEPVCLLDVDIIHNISIRHHLFFCFFFLFF